MFVKNIYETACQERWSLATPLIAADSSSHTRFSRQESQLLLHSRTSGFSAGTFNTTCYSMPGWSGSGLPDLFPFRTSAGGTSHWNKLGIFGSIKWHICKKVPHLISIRAMQCWLATQNASSAIMSHALQQTKAAPVGVICQGASSAPHFLLARLSKGYSFQLVFQLHSLSPVHLAFTLFVFCRLLSRNYLKRGILTGISWDFFGHIKWQIFSVGSWNTSLDVNKANGMLTSNAQRIFCYNATCFATNKSCSSRSHLSGCFKCSSRLACKAARLQLSTCFPIP